MRNLKISSLFLLTFGCVWSQKKDTSSFSVRYSEVPKIHARALVFSENKLYLGTNTGQLFSMDVRTKKFEQYEQKFFKEYRDIEVLKDQILVMSSGDTSALLAFDKKSKEVTRAQIFNGVFLDGLAKSPDSILVLGDPVKGQFSVFSAPLSTLNFNPLPGPEAKNGEASYAASGSTIHFENGKFYLFSGGSANRIFTFEADHWEETNVPFEACPTCGTYSAFIAGKKIYVAGGNYLESTKSTNNFLVSKNGGKSWKQPKRGPFGYRCSIVGKGKYLFAAGTTGLDFSKNDGKTWNTINTENYFSLLLTEDYLIASRSNGYIDFFPLERWIK